MITLLEKQHPKMNDNAVQFYSDEQKTNAPIFSVNDRSRPDEMVAGSSRKNEKAPVVFIIGDSTATNGRG